MIEESKIDNIEVKREKEGGAAPAASSAAVAVVDKKEAELSTILSSFPGVSLEMAQMIAQDAFALVNINGAADELGMSMPFRKIEYCATQEAQDAGLVKGQFTDTLTGTQKPTMTVLLLAQKFSRVLQTKYDPMKSEQDRPLCMSHDGRARAVGEEGGTDTTIPACQECAVCPNSKWSAGRDGKQVPPTCSDVFTLLLFDVEDMMPFLFQIRRTGIAPWRKALQAVKVAAMRYRVGELAHAPANVCVQFLMSTKAEKIFFRPQFSQFEGADPELVIGQVLPALASFVTGFQNVNAAAVVDEESIIEAQEEGPAVNAAANTFPGEPAGFDPSQFARGGSARGNTRG